ncbi:FtsX-like permease family protein [Terrisporobacter sp.]|uniref:FtsX-like permease family protein n=1 Tax=Terrisporobacter sp. TaxID=1965305 RepID=UPI002A823CC7|nr:FtsX-like permease family protein [Terrisporobacter sp.]MDY4735457.1 FtsX-like permease family protein [Terrisporobacter sp.]
MNLFKLSFMNLKQNIKNYGMYVFSMIFSILVFYNFRTLSHSEQFNELQDIKVVSVISAMCAMVLFLFFIYFISYSSKFFIEQRKKEFGIYTFMGVENKKIALLFAGEGLLIGIIALIGGILGGILTNKLFLMALVKISNINKVMKFEISYSAIIDTSCIFIAILIIVFIKEYIILLKTDISKLINATHIYQRDDSKNKTLQGLLGLIIILLAYTLIIYYKKFNIMFAVAIMATVIMVILGTVLLFKGFFTFIVGKLIDNKNFLYKNTNIISYNNIIFRIRDNNKVLAQITILITCCLTALTVSLATRTVFTDSKKDDYPYSIMYEGNLNDKVVEKALIQSKEKIDFKLDTKIIPLKTKLAYINEADLISYSQVKKILNYRNLDNENKFLETDLKNNEAILLIPKSMINAFNFNVNINLGNEKIKIIDSYSMNLFGRMRNDQGTIIVNDNTYNTLKKQLKEKEINISSITLKNFDNSKEISKYIKENSKLQVYSVDNFDDSSYSFINAIYFIGMFLALVFIVSVGSIMYFKCISDASKDKERFDTLRKIGTSEEYINKSIYKQIGIFFLFPAIVSIIHSAVASYAVTNLFNQDWKMTMLIITILFIVIYTIYYLITARKYISLTK